MNKNILSAIFKPQAFAVVKYVLSGIALAVSTFTIIVNVKTSLDTRFAAYENRTIQRQRFDDSIQNAKVEQILIKIVNKIEDLDSSTNKSLGLSKELREAKKENFKLYKENLNLKALSLEKKNSNYLISNQFPEEFSIIKNTCLKE